MTYLELIRSGKDILDNKKINDSQFDSRMLLMNVTGIGLSELVMKYHDEASEKEARDFFALISKRAEHYPLQYLTGRAAFMDFEFNVSEAVLIPRQDTEILVSEALNYIKEKEPDNKKLSILDLCTGSGCIGISVYKYLTEEGKDISLTLSDISNAALEICKKNCTDLGVDCEIIRSDMFGALEGRRFDLILSNPPYIRTGDVARLMPEVADFEPEEALCGNNENEDGLYYYRIIAENAAGFLKKDGRIFLEIGFDQADAVRAVFYEKGYNDIDVINDLAGLDRVVAIGR